MGFENHNFSDNSPYQSNQFSNTNIYQNQATEYSYVNDLNSDSASETLRASLSQEVVSKSFIFMFFALLITAFAAFSINSEIALSFYINHFRAIMFSELAIVIVSNIAISKNKPVLAAILFTAYSYLTGVFLSLLTLIYTGTSILTVFLTTAGIFGAMAIYGLVTKRDLTKFGSIAIMGLLSIIIVNLVNLVFLHNSTLDCIICSIGVLIFVGLTAYDTQKIKQSAAYATNENVLSLALLGAFNLYLDFINIFLKLLRLFGKRK